MILSFMATNILRKFLHINIWELASLIISVQILALRKGYMEVEKLTIRLKIIVDWQKIGYGKIKLL